MKTNTFQIFYNYFKEKYFINETDIETIEALITFFNNNIKERNLKINIDRERLDYYFFEYNKDKELFDVLDIKDDFILDEFNYFKKRYDCRNYNEVLYVLIQNYNEMMENKEVVKSKFRIDNFLDFKPLLSLFRYKE